MTDEQIEVLLRALGKCFEDEGFVVEFRPPAHLEIRLDKHDGVWSVIKEEIHNGWLGCRENKRYKVHLSVPDSIPRLIASSRYCKSHQEENSERCGKCPGVIDVNANTKPDE